MHSFQSRLSLHQTESPPYWVSGRTFAVFAFALDDAALSPIQFRGGIAMQSVECDENGPTGRVIWKEV